MNEGTGLALNDEVDLLYRQAKEELEQTGDVDPRMVVTFMGGEVAMLMFKEREQAKRWLEMFAEKINRVIYISEVWLKSNPTPEEHDTAMREGVKGVAGREEGVRMYGREVGRAYQRLTTFVKRGSRVSFVAELPAMNGYVKNLRESRDRIVDPVFTLRDVLNN